MSLTPKFPKFLHGGDYNPDQWLDRPDILERDVEMMREAHVNCVSVGIFAWARLEPEDGVYDFTWLDEVIDRLWKNGIHVDLATPSGARPAWMAQKYPEVLRVTPLHQKKHFGERHNHCLTSPVYRKKVHDINTALAERYGKHPAVIMWHLSNEYGGECHCELCQQAFRDWLKEKYGTLENLNKCWWSSFWSHRYTDWSQIEAPSPLGMQSNLCQQVDWRRFVTGQCKSFIEAERAAIRAVCPDLPCTANLMYRFPDYDYFSLAEAIDLVSWDAYPSWHNGDDVAVAADFAFHHELMRSLKDQPFLLMESTPSQVNWHAHNKLKRPGMHLLSSLQAVAHGSQSVMYFQWRKGRGASEMFHGAVVDHYGGTDTRVFRDVTQVGESLEKLQPIYDTQRKAQACVLFDWENWWAIEHVQTGNRGDMKYVDTVVAHYRALWERGVNVDIRDMRDCTDLSGYKLVIAPMLFMFRNDIQQKLHTFVENGGTLVMTYFSGVVDEHYLAYQGATPNGLTDMLGLRATDLDALYPGQSNALVVGDKQYEITELCEIPASVTAQTVGAYGSDFYGGEPCLTVNNFGQGRAWYLCAKVEQAGLDEIYDRVLSCLDLPVAMTAQLPKGVIATAREDVIFLQNFSGAAQQVTLDRTYTDLLTGETVSGVIEMATNGLRVLR